MVRIRFRRVGARNQPSFRIVAADKESPRDGRFLEVLGSYNPRTNPSTVKVDEARLFHWLSHGAQPSDSVVQTLQTVGTWERWERFKGGESLDTLIQEAEAAIPEVDPRTRRDDQIGQRSKKRRRHADAEAAPAEPEEDTEAESAEPAEEEAAEPAEAEAEEPVEAEAAEPAEAEAAEAEAEPVAEEASTPEAESSAAEDVATEDEAEPAEAEAEEEDEPEAENAEAAPDSNDEEESE